MDPRAQIKRQAEESVPIYKERHGRFLGFSGQKIQLFRVPGFISDPVLLPHAYTHIETHTHTPLSKVKQFSNSEKKKPPQNKTDVGERGTGG